MLSNLAKQSPAFLKREKMSPRYATTSIGVAELCPDPEEMVIKRSSYAGTLIPRYEAPETLSSLVMY